MWQLIKNAKIYSPEPVEDTDVLIVGERIAALGRGLTLPDYAEGSVVDVRGAVLAPGFIDAHVHICGGGGEAGPASRTPEIQLSHLTLAGTTTVVGCLGTDSVSRSMTELLVKARALEDEGLTTYIYSGGYQVPPKTLFPTLRQDLTLVDKVIGAGEIAISDHRSAQPQIAELEHLCAEARVGGMLGGKAGIVHLHLGEGKHGLEPVRTILNRTEIPITQFMPTHINRTYSLLEEGIEFLKAGGHIDLTAGCDDFPKDLQVPAVLKMLHARRVLNDRVTVTSDGNGSMPQYNEAGQLVGMGVGKVSVLWRDVREAVVSCGLPLEAGLRTITANVARVLNLERTGMIRKGYAANLVVLDEDYQVRHVWAKGKLMVRAKEVLVKGTYE
ncbi:beta-aspartyl-peptidase [Acididesulfobacillus acetoxydans]|uniref:Isoaspartyl dipeptidase n=1 Tax=Acididesulfobacillus acetoxydans TaxID=1561005 RepID=A0A8S0WFW3_9FIRM|nr:beta-aspartyl-peptidase [Acididesulfobacillus acetoxydans]CAA7601402.1 beta-aspartyl-peptidase [Acididesulfobacillus acetoxydans]CEJ08833.1 Isoaspartyl dipeptidase [Acididesulfobacillus acetoxydans]